MAAPKSQYLMEKPMAQRSHQEKLRVAHTAADPKETHEGSHIGGAPGKYEYLKPFSKEWYQYQEKEERRINSLLTICRGC